MRKLEELKEVYPALFREWFNRNDIIQLLDEMDTSREIAYIDKHGIGTFELDEVELEDIGNNIFRCDGKGTTSLRYPYHTQNITVYYEILLNDWDEEEKMYRQEWASIIGWE